jgi:Phospholipase_D-nuclease N-terminal
MGRLIWIIIFVIDVVVILDIIRSTKDTEKKILWVIAVLLLPVLGPILYYVIGKK